MCMARTVRVVPFRPRFPHICEDRGGQNNNSPPRSADLHSALLTDTPSRPLSASLPAFQAPREATQA